MGAIAAPARAIPAPAIISGRSYGFRTAFASNAGASALTANTLYAAPFLSPLPFTADRISLNLTVAGAAATGVRLGLYSTDP
ncbi:MAG TPA: hypothetical protein VIL85_02900, partial [Thermomicrobiales bacterium]